MEIAGAVTRFESRVVSVSWIPSEAIRGLPRVPFDAGLAHYDDPPPAQLGDLDAWCAEDRVRFANDLRAWIEVVDGEVVGYGQSGGGMIGSTTMGLGPASVTFPAFALADLAAEPEVTPISVTFRQTAGGRTGVPAPRRVSARPFVQYQAPTAWTTLSLTLFVDGSSEGMLAGASPFPRHWVYGPDGQLMSKSGVVHFKDWYHHAFGSHSPWGGEDSPAVIAELETALERELAMVIMRTGRSPKVRRVTEGGVLTRQGEDSTDLLLLLDGVVSVQVDDTEVAVVGPGALLGERAILEQGRRTATTVALSPCRVATARKVDIDLVKLAQVSAGHRREEQPIGE